MSRLIDADALINELNNSRYPGAPYIDAGISIAIGKVCDALTIEPEPHWIPCSERLPKEAGWYIVTMPYDITGFRWYSTAHGFEKFEGDGDVIAWMPLPSVYKGE